MTGFVKLSDEELNTQVIACVARSLDCENINYKSRKHEGRHLELSELLHEQWSSTRNLYLYFEYVRLIDAIDILFTPHYNRSGRYGRDFRSEWPWHTKSHILELIEKIFADGFDERSSSEKKFVAAETILLLKKAAPIFKPGNDEPLKKALRTIVKTISDLEVEGELQELRLFVISLLAERNVRTEDRNI